MNYIEGLIKKDSPKKSASKTSNTSNTSKYYTPPLSRENSSITKSKSSKYYTPTSKISMSSSKSTPNSTRNSKVYNSLSIETKSIIDEISVKPNLKKSPTPFITDKAIQKIQKFFKKYAVDEKYTLDNRVKYYNYLINYIKGIKNNECIKYSKIKSVKYTIGDKLYLIKKIGTESVGGVIYLTVLKNVLGGNLLASKITPILKDNHREIKIMKNLTEKIISQKKSKHFLIMYKHFVCPPMSILEMMKHPLGSQVSRDKRLVSINELAHGDLKMLMEDRKIVANDELMYNIFIQTFLSIVSFHNLTGYYHNDTHYGNFLYQKNKEVGYYHYKYKSKSYYLKACEYNIMIYDYGYATKSYKKYNKKSLNDYMKIINSFINEKDGWGFFPDLPSDKFNDTMTFVREILMTEYDSDNKNGDTQNIILDTILLNVLKYTYPNFNLFITDKPSNIINKTPYILA